MIPKFRAWDPYEEKMIDDKELVIWGGNIYRGDRDKIFQKIIKGKKGLIGYSFDDEYLMQSTGLKDKNGVEIFDGDIMFYEQDCYQYTLVKYDKDKLAFVLYDGCERLYHEFWEAGEVIGNIYENPELLESVEE